MAAHGNGFAGLDLEADVAQDPVFVFVGEPDVVELHGGGRWWKGPGLGGRLDSHGRIEQFKDSLGRGPGGLHDFVFFAQVLNGTEKSHAILEEGHQYTDLNSTTAD